jgi:hypothetical protein
LPHALTGPQLSLGSWKQRNHATNHNGCSFGLSVDIARHFEGRQGGGGCITPLEVSQLFLSCPAAAERWHVWWPNVQSWYKSGHTAFMLNVWHAIGRLICFLGMSTAVITFRKLMAWRAAAASAAVAPNR